MKQGWLLAIALVAVTFAGCLQKGAIDLDTDATPSTGWLTDAVWDTTGDYSKPLREPLFDVLPVEAALVPSFDGTPIATAIWRPDVPEGTKVPVILDVGPYYGSTIDVLGTGREAQFFIDGFVKQGYAYGRVAVRGTSTSGGCMEFFSMNEQKDVDAIVTHFGTQEWSNGNVALYGASYDGTTPWIAAAFGNPHLKTIVPVSGLTDVAGLMFRNGTAEGRGVFMHSYVYWVNYGWQPASMPPAYRAPHWPEQFCPEVVEGAIEGPLTTATGDRRTPYWEERDFRARVLENYRGSVLLVHGLQDWNVEPSMAFPFVNELEARGIEVKMMLGQWGHDWPDRAVREKHLRWDWAEVLLTWFDKHLKGIDTPTGPVVDVEDNRGNWRTELTWPPHDAALTPFYLGKGIIAAEPQADGSAVAVNPGALVSPLAPDAPLHWTFRLPPQEQELRFAGLAQLHATFVSSAPDGNLYAVLYDVAPGGERTRVAHAVMNIRYHEGGEAPKSVTPGTPFLAKMEFFAADVVIPAGHTLELVVQPNTPSEPRPRGPVPMTMQWGGEKSVLRLPLIDRAGAEFGYPGMPDA